MQDIGTRTRTFALLIIRLYSSLPNTTEASVIGRQLLRSGTSVGAHFCEATRSRSSAEIVSKVDTGLQELEESRYWLELLLMANIVPQDRLAPLLGEVRELNAILTSVSKGAKTRIKDKR